MSGLINDFDLALHCVVSSWRKRKTYSYIVIELVTWRQYYKKNFEVVHLKKTMFSVLSIVLFLSTQHFLTVVESSENVWSSWSSWSACNAHDIARHTRFRKCLDGKGKTLNPTECVGLAKRTRQCKSCSYPLFNQNGQPQTMSKSRDVNLAFSGIDATNTSWCLSQMSHEDKYIEISFQNFVQLTGIETRGDSDGYVKKYKIKYSYDGQTWHSHSENEFSGNTDATQIFRNKFQYRLVTRHIRVYPTSYTARACFKVKLYGCEYNCGGLITHDASVIEPPTASRQIEELNCLWRIESESASKLRLTFSYLKLQCEGGVLDVYDGTKPHTLDNTENVLEGFCGNSEKGFTQTFEKRALWMYHHTNKTDSNIGFNIQVNSIVLKTLNATSGEIVLPHRADYSHIYRYNWIITAPKDNDTIEMRLDYFHTNNTRTFGNKCIADVIVINHGNEKPLIEKYCDTKQPKVFTSYNGYMKIKYKSKTDNPKWRVKFSYQILGYPEKHTTTKNTGSTSTMTGYNHPKWATIPSSKVNDTAATQKKTIPESSSKVPIIVSSVVACLIAVVCVIALIHYLRRRKEYLKKHPYDCSNRPMSHFGDQDATPFINTNLLMWNDSKNSVKSEKPKNFEKSKKSLPVVEVSLRENEPERLSIIPAEVLKSSSQVSVGVPGNEETGTLKVSDNFTEECMTLLSNNLSSTLEGDNDKYNPEDMPEKCNEDKRYGSLPEADRRSPEVDDGQGSLPEAEGQSPETDKLLQD